MKTPAELREAFEKWCDKNSEDYIRANDQHRIWIEFISPLLSALEIIRDEQGDRDAALALKAFEEKLK